MTHWPNMPAGRIRAGPRTSTPKLICWRNRRGVAVRSLAQPVLPIYIGLLSSTWCLAIEATAPIRIGHITILIRCISMATSPNLANLQPRSVWAHFATLCAIPLPRIMSRADRKPIAWANAHGIESFIDGAGNLLLKKPASPGCGSMPADPAGPSRHGVPSQCRHAARTLSAMPSMRGAHGWVVRRAPRGRGQRMASRSPGCLEEPGLVHPHWRCCYRQRRVRHDCGGASRGLLMARR